MKNTKTNTDNHITKLISYLLVNEILGRRRRRREKKLITYLITQYIIIIFTIKNMENLYFGACL